jgi:hypothetical protein
MPMNVAASKAFTPTIVGFVAHPAASKDLGIARIGSCRVAKTLSVLATGYPVSRLPLTV